MYNGRVFCRFQFDALHHWPEAPNDVAFLRNPHRHVFHVEAWARIEHSDRDVEFIDLKYRMEEFCHAYMQNQDLGRASCEDICVTFLNNFKEVDSITVSEDNENGAHMWRSLE